MAASVVGVKMQVSFKNGNGPLINLYGEDGPELAALLDELSDVISKIEEVNSLLGAVAAVMPLTQPAGGAVQPQPAFGTPGGLPQPSPVEQCQHGPMLWKTGTSKQGNIYGLWECPTGLKPDQGGCAVRWPKRGR